jgi:cytochrome c
MKIVALSAALAVAASGAWASGDAAKGEQVFKRCQACHSIVDPSGKKIAGMGKIGPNLWGVVGRKAGSEEGFHYDEALKAAGEKGLVWTPDELVKWLADPSKFLKDYLGNPSAHSKMTYKNRKESDSEDVIAYLAQFGPSK